MTKQEIFDKVAIHLLTQGKKAQGSDGACLYRAPDGSKCAIGCLITDENYHPGLENLNVNRPSLREALEKSLSISLETLEGGSLIPFLFGLQRIHDNHPHGYWEIDLLNFAKNHELNHDCLSSFIQNS